MDMSIVVCVGTMEPTERNPSGQRQRTALTSPDRNFVEHYFQDNGP